MKLRAKPEVHNARMTGEASRVRMPGCADSPGEARGSWDDDFSDFLLPRFVGRVYRRFGGSTGSFDVQAMMGTYLVQEQICSRGREQGHSSRHETGQEVWELSE
jgi:hypothetical protein